MITAAEARVMTTASENYVRSRYIDTVDSQIRNAAKNGTREVYLRIDENTHTTHVQFTAATTPTPTKIGQTIIDILRKNGFDVKWEIQSAYISNRVGEPPVAEFGITVRW